MDCHGLGWCLAFPGAGADGALIFIYIFIVEMMFRRASRASAGFRRGVEIPTVFSFARGQKWLRLFCFCASDIA